MLGKKVGTTATFREDGRSDSVTAIRVGPCTITQIKRMDKDGYESVQLGFEPVRRLNKAETGHLQGSGGLFRYLREVESDDLSELELGQTLDVGVFQTGDRVDATGLSKGRGFAGGVKRYHFKGGPKTHGQSDRHRAPGSIGAGTSPGRVIKGHKMAGHMGNARVTVRNLEVVLADPGRGLLLVKGGVPGASNGLVMVSKSRR
jgi:large subunit ribosomal protein L3